MDTQSEFMLKPRESILMTQKTSAGETGIGITVNGA
jgi:hypothetical protein